MKKIYFVSLGCPRNFVDTEVMLGILLKAGYEITSELKEADFLIVNTCAFLKASREESKESISSLLKEKKPSAHLVVTGCMVAHHLKEIEEAFPEVHYFLGAGDIGSILSVLQSQEKGKKIGNDKSYLEKEGEIPRKIATPSTYAYLKIAEGCRKGCSYCLIPKIKGPLKSKPKQQILSEFRSLLAEGIKEIILIAQDLGDWGKDRSEGGLVDLLRELLSIEGDYWLRLLYLYPDEITDDLIALMKSDSRIVPYLDMPIQHISDPILTAMRRKTTGGRIKELVVKLKKEIPEIQLRTSLIVGFPGETESHFQELSHFVQAFELHNVGLFAFSREEGTAAFELPEQIPEEIKEKRIEQLSKLQFNVVERLNRKYIGRRLEVIIEGYHPESDLLMVGRHRGQAPEIDGQVIINDGRKVKAFGERYLVEITGTAGYDLVGRVLKENKNKFHIL